MAERPPTNGDQIDIPMPWGGHVLARGSIIVILLMLLAGGYLTYLFNRERAEEHDAIQRDVASLNCLVRLDIYIHSYAIDQPIEFRKMPTELWGCLPSFLADKDVQRRER